MYSKPNLKVVIGLLMVFGWVNLAFAFYNPQQGRWLNRDPVSETVDRNLSVLPGTLHCTQLIH